MVSYFAGGQKGFDGIDTHLTTPFDFPMNSAIREVVNHGASAKKIVDVLRQDRLYPHPELLVTFIGNHDMKRFLTDAEGLDCQAEAGLLAAGDPAWHPADLFRRRNRDARRRRSRQSSRLPGRLSRRLSTTPSRQAGRTPTEQDVYAHVQGLLKLRREHPALRLGVQKHVVVTDDYYLFTRETAGERLLIVFYKGEAAKSVTVDLTDTSIANAKAFQGLNSAPAATLQGTQLQLQLLPQSVAIYQVN